MATSADIVRGSKSRWLGKSQWSEWPIPSPNFIRRRRSSNRKARGRPASETAVRAGSCASPMREQSTVEPSCRSLRRVGIRKEFCQEPSPARARDTQERAGWHAFGSRVPSVVVLTTPRGVEEFRRAMRRRKKGLADRIRRPGDDVEESAHAR